MYRLHSASFIWETTGWVGSNARTSIGWGVGQIRGACDRFEAAVSRDLGQRVTARTHLVRVRSDFEQQLRGLEVPFVDGEAKRRVLLR
jgi:hypothetical protein